MSAHSTAFASGFTLLEIVCVLALLGILSAVALPKYFDLQAEAQEKACAQNRSVVLSTLNGEFVTVALNGESFATIDQSWVNEKLLAIRDAGKKLCPAEGVISARPNFDSDIYSFGVWCSIHRPDSGNASEADDAPDVPNGSNSITANNAFLDWVLRVFKQPIDAPVDSPWGTGDKTDLATFFYQNSYDTEVDSDATGSSSYMASYVDKAMKADGIDMSNAIWKLSKEDWKRGANTGTLVITIADRNDVSDANVGQSINATQYRVKVTYAEDGTLTFGPTQVTENTSITLDKNTAKNYYKLKP